MGSPLQFVPFQSSVEPAFWSELSNKKLNTWRLDDGAKEICGGFGASGSRLASPFTLSPAGFTPEKTMDASSAGGLHMCPGLLMNANTVEQFKKYDKNTLLSEAANRVWASIVSGKALDCPGALSSFVLLTFADLKQHKFYYWFGFPALFSKVESLQFKLASPVRKLHEEFSKAQVAAFFNSLAELRAASNPPFFLAKHDSSGGFTLAPLSELRTFFDGAEEITIGMMDPTHQHMAPGWPLRNLLLAIHCYAPKAKKIDVICVRGSTPADNLSILVRVMAPTDYTTIPAVLEKTRNAALDRAKPLDGTPFSAVGWENNVSGRPGPRQADLGSLMDPQRLAETSVNLNLQLMKWRLMPNLDIEKVARTRCLLLGAGTLGCAVARVLMGWGVRTITFVDNGKVSHSNPARQSLFEFADVGKDKAQTAAQRMLRIFPGLNTKGEALTIPMPGHAVSDKTRSDVQATVAKLEALYDQHDVIFLLTDSRESRWLPTVLARSKGKLLMNAALGFDSYLVMRHGCGVPSGQPSTSSGFGDSGLGCYFCNDVVAPADSLTDRTLDQQCTVTRPGLAFSAASLLVELMVSVLQHPKGIFTLPETDAEKEKDEGSPLGEIPHQVRGFLTNFRHMIITGSAFEKCTACSSSVVSHYQEEGYGFLEKVFNDGVGTYLEDLTGLTAMKQQVDDLDWDDDGDMDMDGSGDDF